MVHVWAEALGATALVGCAPVLLIFCVPIGRPGYENLLNSFLSFAVGGLLGDVFLHLLPHAFSAPHSHSHLDPTTAVDSHHDHDHHHSHDDHHHHDHDHGHSHGHDHGPGVTLGMWVVAGIMIFFIIERVVRSTGAGGHSHGHGHAHADEDKQTTKSSSSSGKKNNSDSGVRRRRKKGDDQNSNGVKDAPAEEEDTAGGDGQIQVAGYLNLAADFTHNFTDGLAIGASFLAGRQVGWITTVAVLFHEVPHEIGDFAILIQSGFSRSAAIYAQLVTAIGALVGTALALQFGGASTPAILAFTAGGFIYIATVTVIPELLAGKASLKQSIIEVLMMSAGVGLMVIVGWIEELTEAPH